MSREIKFKFWNRIVGRMSESYTLEELHKEKINFIILEKLEYTGLNDRNEVEVYEGDFLKHPNSTFLFVVVFEKGAFRLQSQEPSLLRNNIKADIEHLEFCEKIGNIYENLELLKN